MPVVIALVALAAAVAAVLVRPKPAPVSSIERLPVYQSPALLARAWALPVARLYGPDGYVFQRNPSVCGPTSAADLLRSQRRPATPEAVLQGTGVKPIFGLLPRGMTLDQEAAMLRLRTAGTVTVLRGLSPDAFRAEMAQANDPHHRYIVNFTRAPLFGRGHGHFSPVLGYLPAEDLVFVGDVNAGYKPWLAPTARLYAAQDTLDADAHAKRGLLRVDLP